MRFLISGIAALALILPLGGLSQAGVYQYFDEDGTLIVTDNPHLTKRTPSAPPVRKLPVNVRLRDDIYYDYYPVRAGDFGEAIAKTRVVGPYDEKEGRSYAGQTRWRLGWSYRFDSSYRIEGDSAIAALSIYDFVFLSDITVLLPALSEDSSLDAAGMAMWESFLAGLLEHEHDHVALIQDATLREEALSRVSAITELTLPSQPLDDIGDRIREAVESETAKIGHALMKKIKAANAEYDRLTEHGARPEMRAVFLGK